MSAIRRATISASSSPLGLFSRPSRYASISSAWRGSELGVLLCDFAGRNRSGPRIPVNRAFVTSTSGPTERKFVPSSTRLHLSASPPAARTASSNTSTTAPRNLYIDCLGSPTKNRLLPYGSPVIREMISSCSLLVSWYSSTRTNLNLLRHASPAGVSRSRSLAAISMPVKSTRAPWPR